MLNGVFSEDQLKFIEQLDESEQFSGIVQNIESNEASWLEFMQSNDPEEVIPKVKV